MPNNILPPNATVEQEVDWYKAELGTWDNLDKAWDPSFKADFKRLSGAAIQTIILGSEPHQNIDIGSDAFGMAGAYQRLITTEQLSAMKEAMIMIIYPSIVLSDDIDFSKLDYLRTYLMATYLDTSLAADDPQAKWVSKITAAQVAALDTADGFPPQYQLFKFWTNPKNLSTNADVALPYLESLREKFQAIGGHAIAIAMGNYYDDGQKFTKSNIDPRVSQLLTTEQTNDSFGYFRISSEGISRWLEQNFKDIAALKRKDVLIQDLSPEVVNAMAIELARTSQVNGEFGYWVWQLSDAQIKGLSKEASFALFKAWVGDNGLDETYSPNGVVNATLARQFKNFSSSIVETIIQTNFGLAARYQWLLTAEQVNGLSFDSLSRIFGTVAQRTDLSSGLSNETVNKMAILLEQQGNGQGQVNGKYGHWVWGLSDAQIKGLSKEAGFALFKAWVSHDWLDETYSPNHVVNDTLARQFKNFSGSIVETIIQTNFGLAARYQWLLTADQVNRLSFNSLSRIFGIIAQRTDLSSGFSAKTVSNMAVLRAQQEVEWYKAELGTWDNLDKAWDPSFKTDFKRLSGAAIQRIILGSGPHFVPWPKGDAFGMAGAYQRLITTEQLNAMDAFMMKIIHPSVILSTDLDVSKLYNLQTKGLVEYGLDYSLAADDPRASWVSKITASQVSAIGGSRTSNYQDDPHYRLYHFWTNKENLSKDPAVALPYLTGLREKLQAINGLAIATAMGYYYDQGEKFATSNINSLVSQLLTTNQTNDSFKYFSGSSEGVKSWLRQNFKDIATLKRKDVVIQDLSASVVDAMAVELDRTSQVNGEFGYWVWQLSDAQIKGLSTGAGFALFKAWVSHDWLDETYSPNEVVNDTLARQFKNFSSDIVNTIIQTDFGLAARYQWLLSADQVNGLESNSISAIGLTIKLKFKYDELSKSVWDVLGVKVDSGFLPFPVPVPVEPIDQKVLNQSTINANASSLAELLIHRMASATNVPSANTNVFNPNASLGASSSNQALVTVH